MRAGRARGAEQGCGMTRSRAHGAAPGTRGCRQVSSNDTDGKRSLYLPIRQTCALCFVEVISMRAPLPTTVVVIRVWLVWVRMLPHWLTYTKHIDQGVYYRCLFGCYKVHYTLLRLHLDASSAPLHYDFSWLTLDSDSRLRLSSTFTLSRRLPLGGIPPIGSAVKGLRLSLKVSSVDLILIIYTGGAGGGPTPPPLFSPKTKFFKKKIFQ